MMAALGAGATVGILLPMSRAQESEADRIGLILMAMAGYDPREAITVWERMRALCYDSRLVSMRELLAALFDGFETSHPVLRIDTSESLAVLLR